MARGNRARLRSNNEFQKPYNTVKPPKKEDTGPSIGPLLVGLFLFVVVGSAFVQIFQTVGSGPPGGLGNAADDMADAAPGFDSAQGFEP
mmetsp:Transcript_16566/g.20462  ORF Transcript_16566/g.20462 Transcript_16566/m.20462 type:complete len:89 (+) Transcript_16566:193-459(+)|eukprot:CAMPEP_0204828464 /NCGR_PEP_ID=MMETSP1346-20131115/6238_1 /ASSEMBLY_ACC=CAM_ASM_000771 /TAXON_ID=215587 /ORGANISM="Aplanochytrium stocchinoi, Strain GSBS06" /LENGTH=88 /DNA_ID=CAMNT_0051957557 /DNA_START=148 /DNA_END=414 /DNA_ORIENTATION=+